MKNGLGELFKFWLLGLNVETAPSVIQMDSTPWSSRLTPICVAWDPRKVNWKKKPDGVTIH